MAIIIYSHNDYKKPPSSVKEAKNQNAQECDLRGRYRITATSLNNKNSLNLSYWFPWYTQQMFLILATYLWYSKPYFSFSLLFPLMIKLQIDYLSTSANATETQKKSLWIPTLSKTATKGGRVFNKILNKQPLVISLKKFEFYILLNIVHSLNHLLHFRFCYLHFWTFKFIMYFKYAFKMVFSWNLLVFLSSDS